MKFFVDTADLAKSGPRRQRACWTASPPTRPWSPSPAASSSRSSREICYVVPGPVSAEVTATDYDDMLARRPRRSRKIAKNVAVKVPLTPDGLRACKALSNDGTMVNVTLCFSAAQALLAAKAGATFISPFVGRLDDIGRRHGADRRHLPDLIATTPISRPRSWSPRSATRCT